MTHSIRRRSDQSNQSVASPRGLRLHDDERPLSAAKERAHNQEQTYQASREREGPLYQWACPSKDATEDHHPALPSVLLV